MQHLKIRVHGKVQGVHFRQSTKAVADQLGVRGWTKNEDDGAVYIEAEAEEWLLESFLEWCAEGPERAEVLLVEKEIGEIQGFQNFVVKK
jgi:acylphosphatase